MNGRPCNDVIGSVCVDKREESKLGFYDIITGIAALSRHVPRRLRRLFFFLGGGGTVSRHFCYCRNDILRNCD